MKTILTKFELFDREQLLYYEWLITNGLGGYACGSVSGTPMRRYHSLLNAALSNPYGRTVMLNYVRDVVILPDKSEVVISSHRANPEEQTNVLPPKEFRLENGLPVWTYDLNGVIIEKSLLLVHKQNTLHMSYTLKSEQEGVFISWKPFLHFRSNEDPVDLPIPEGGYTVHAKDSLYEIVCQSYPSLKLYNGSKASFVVQRETVNNIFYEFEAERGYASYGSLQSPGFYLNALPPKERVTFIASTENWQTVLALSPREAWLTENMRRRNLLRSAPISRTSSLSANLVLAADQFLIKPTTRFNDMIRLQAAGEEIRSVIAGFPWFNDWGRDTMISLEGLTLTTGRFREAHSILHTFAHYIQDGLIPNMFPEGENKGIYNTADATLWFFHAIDRYITITGDDDILEFLLPKLDNIIHFHTKGTQFGIRMDEDGLLIQGHPGVQLTWMDAKVGDWVVTPRRGKAVEINGLWYNALKLYETWAGKSPELSDLCRASFNEKFWNERDGYLYDVIEGESGTDPAMRPNQLFAISLKHPVLDKQRWKPVLDAVQRDLYTPFGLRTLSPRHPDYKGEYHGDLKARDAAYHQGSVWPWLLGAYVDVWLKVYPSDIEGVSSMLNNLEAHINSSCIGSISEIFDSSAPYRSRGCFAQAWSVAEVLRCLDKIALHAG